MMSPLNATGEIFAARVNSSGWIPGPNKLTNDPILSANTSCILTTGINGAALASGSILELPVSASCTAQELLTDVWTMGFIPTSPEAYSFQNSINQTQYSGSLALAQGAVVHTGTGAIDTSALDHPSNEKYGWDVIVVYGQNFPVNTSVLEVRYCLHLEGTPTIGNTGSIVIPDSAANGPILPSFLTSVIDVARSIGLEDTIMDAAKQGMSILAKAAKSVIPIAIAAVL